jgi:enediyne biosynthesis protein E9
VTAHERVDVVVIGTGFGGAIPAYYLAAAGARVLMLERGPHLRTEEFTHDLQLGTYTRIVDYLRGDGVDVVAGNCVGGSSVVYFAASLRAPSFVFERQGSAGRRQWPASLDRAALDPWYDRVEETIPVSEQPWDQVSYAGGLWAALCDRAGHTCNTVPVAVDQQRCTNCNWMLQGCRFGAKRSMLLNYLPAAEAEGAEIRALHEVQAVRPATQAGARYAVDYLTLDAGDYRRPTGGGRVEAKVVIMAAGAMGTPVILRRSAPWLGGMPDAVGRHFSPNGDRVTLVDIDEDRLGSLTNLRGADGGAYRGYPIGKPIGTTTFDFLDPSLPEFDRFALQQIYFPAITNLLSEDGVDGDPVWFGEDKKALSARWRSWLTVLAMTEDDNEGEFTELPPTGNFTRIASAASLAPLRYRPNEHTRRGWDGSDARVRGIVEREGIGRHLLWEQTPNALSAHPLSSARIGDDPATSACDDRHELRGHPGIFVTDSAAVPTALCVNPSLTIAAMAERAAHLILERADELGLELTEGAPPPGSSPEPTPRPTPPPSREGRERPLPATGGGPLIAGLGAAAAGYALRRTGRSERTDST